jgi:hypothetical protein
MRKHELIVRRARADDEEAATSHRKPNVTRTTVGKIHPVAGWLGGDTPIVKFAQTNAAGTFNLWPVKCTKWEPRGCNKSGMGHILMVALNRLRQASKKRESLEIVLHANRTLYGARNSAQNVWEDYFEQPGIHSRRSQVYSDTNFDGMWHPGGSHEGVDIDLGKIDICQSLVKSHIRMTREFQEHVQESANQYLEKGRRYLACHVRLTDKVIEAEQNLDLTVDDIVEAIEKKAEDLECDGVLFCTDTNTIKRRVKAALKARCASLHIAGYPSVLPEAGGVAPHNDTSLDKVVKTKDIMTEIMLMALFCHGIIATRSNVSTVVVAMANTSYKHSHFWTPTAAVQIIADDDASENTTMSKVVTFQNIEIGWLDKTVLCLHAVDKTSAVLSDGDPFMNSVCCRKSVILSDDCEVNQAERHKVMSLFRVESHAIKVHCQSQTVYGVAGNKKMRQQVGKLALAVSWTLAFDMDHSNWGRDMVELVQEAKRVKPRT